MYGVSKINKQIKEEEKNMLLCVQCKMWLTVSTVLFISVISTVVVTITQVAFWDTQSIRRTLELTSSTACSMSKQLDISSNFSHNKVMRRLPQVGSHLFWNCDVSLWFLISKDFLLVYLMDESLMFMLMFLLRTLYLVMIVFLRYGLRLRICILIIRFLGVCPLFTEREHGIFSMSLFFTKRGWLIRPSVHIPSGSLGLHIFILCSGCQIVLATIQLAKDGPYRHTKCWKMGVLRAWEWSVWKVFEVVLVGRLGPRMRQVIGIWDCPTERSNFGVDAERPIVTNGSYRVSGVFVRMCVNWLSCRLEWWVVSGVVSGIGVLDGIHIPQGLREVFWGGSGLLFSMDFHSASAK